MQQLDNYLSTLHAILTLSAWPSRTAATTVAQAPVPQASVAPTINSSRVQLSNQKTKKVRNQEVIGEAHDYIQFAQSSQ